MKPMEAAAALAAMGQSYEDLYRAATWTASTLRAHGVHNAKPGETLAFDATQAINLLQDVEDALRSAGAIVPHDDDSEAERLRRIGLSPAHPPGD